MGGSAGQARRHRGGLLDPADLADPATKRPPGGAVIELHAHSIQHSLDSGVQPDAIVEQAIVRGLDGVCLTEHGGGWDKWDFQRFASQHPDLLLIRAMEVDTDMGHIIVYGLDAYISGIHRIEYLRKVVEEVDGFMVSVHPYRRFFEKPPLNKSLLFKYPVPLEEAVHHRIFALTDAVEIVNGACTLKENDFALQTANKLGKPTLGGSDAHSTHGLGSGATIFEREIRSQADFIKELKAGRFHATDGLLNGHTSPFGSTPN